MARSIAVYVEGGAKFTIAGALEWPGWARKGRTEAAALSDLLAHGPKYASILTGTRLGFIAPKDLPHLVVVERVPGTAGTDFGVPSVAPTIDQDRSCSTADLKRFEKILRAAWRAFDETVNSARGKTLATGPRGGGRSLDAIVAHVIGADAAYLTALGWKTPKAAKPAESLVATRDAIHAGLEASSSDAIPLRGPRGGIRWTARYCVRRVAWHVIAHMWEIERRVAAG
jgi:hypothetical protein